MFNFSKEDIKDFMRKKALQRRGLKLDLDSPKTIQDKINWLIANDDCVGLKSLCVEVVKLHGYCIEKIGEDICVPVLKAYENVEDIDFKELPERFSLKCNNWYDRIISIDRISTPVGTHCGKSLLDEYECKKLVSEWMSTKFGEKNRRRYFSMNRPVCYAEKYTGGGPEYRFWCLNGKPAFVQVIYGKDGGEMRCSFHDTDWKMMNTGWRNYTEDTETEQDKPYLFEEMIKYSEKLSEDFVFVCVDFRLYDGNVFLSGMSFEPEEGIFRLKNRNTELQWGDMLRLDEGISICVTAYKSKDFIKECLDSIMGQTWFDRNSNWEVIVGIDGCEETLEYVKGIMGLYDKVRVLMMDSNRGTYITSNTIMSQAKYNNIIRFDSDDMMLPEMVETIMTKKGDNKLVRYHCKNFGEGPKDGSVVLVYGAVFFRKDIFEKYGGFEPWPCGSDNEYQKRIKNIEKTEDLPDVLMLRRLHGNSLTMSDKTGMKSDFRKPYREYVRKMNVTTEREARILMVKNTFMEIKPGETLSVTETKSETPPITEDMFNKILDNDVVPEKITNLKEKFNEIVELRKSTLYMNGLSICITAYNTQDYIKECLDSIMVQTWMEKHDNWEIIVGVDHCENTLERMKEIIGYYRNIRLLMMDTNNGTYITSNTIIKEAKYDTILRFDSDDIMLPNMLERLIDEKGEYPYITYMAISFGDVRTYSTVKVHGAVMFDKTVFMKYGGFRPWPCSADKEFYNRIKNIEKTKILEENLILRRVHKTQLTTAAATSMRSPLRKKYKEIIDKMNVKTEEEAKIELVTGEFTEIKCDWKKENDNRILDRIGFYMKELEKKPKKTHTEKIERLRRDIRNGKIFSVYSVDGKFVWKKVKK